MQEELKKKIKITQKNEYAMNLLFQVIDDSSGELNKYYYKLGQHFVSLQDYKAAEKFYMKANMHKQASSAPTKHRHITKFFLVLTTF